jgi:hypothetical protein
MPTGSETPFAIHVATVRGCGDAPKPRPPAILDRQSSPNDPMQPRRRAVIVIMKHHA